MTTPLEIPAEPSLPHIDPRVTEIVALVRELSQQTDPQQMVSDFGERFRRMFNLDGFISLSRRGLERPRYRITRSTRFQTAINPWKQSELLPLHEGGLLGDLLYGDEPVLDNDFYPDPSDPAYQHLEGYRSFMAVPHYHDGEAFNMAINLSPEPNAFDPLSFADRILTHNLFGRATQQMVLAQKLREANDALDAELKVVGDIQRSLLPQTLPKIPGLSVAAHYATARRAGGDYYDVLPLPDNKWGMLIADVSGHGTPAAVVMAVTHAVAHSYPGPPHPPGELLSYLNQKLIGRYDANSVTFVTAFYGVYDPAEMTLTYAAAGHPPPRLCRDQQVSQLREAGGLPLGVIEGAEYESATLQLQAGDHLFLFTDGITEAFNPLRDQYGDARLDALFTCPCDRTPQQTIDLVLDDVNRFAQGTAREDDQTLLAVRVT